MTGKPESGGPGAAGAARLDQTFWRPICQQCRRAPATCFGIYELPTDEPPTFACDACCAHGNEDGWCKPVAEFEAWLAHYFKRVAALQGPAAGAARAPLEFVSVRSATLHALEHDVAKDSLKLLLRAWMEASKVRAARAGDPAAPVGEKEGGPAQAGQLGQLRQCEHCKSWSVVQRATSEDGHV